MFDFKYMPSKQKEIKEFSEIIKYLRDMGRNKIIERVNAFKNNEHMPDDILSSILSDMSNGIQNNYMIYDFPIKQMIFYRGW